MHDCHEIGQTPLAFCYLLFHDLHQQPCNEADPYLDLDSVAVISKEVFERKVLFKPLEQRFNLPTPSVSLTNHSCRRIQIIGNEGYLTLFLIGLMPTRKRLTKKSLLKIIPYFLRDIQKKNYTFAVNSIT